ncbi:hypothetical protein EPO15_18630 [bacterium]|nr:MAG: hypothetical protein EPO15_18630 [bacterium]
MKALLMLLALSLPAAAEPLSKRPAPELFAALRAGFLKAAGELDGLEENKAWLAKLPMRLEGLGATTAAFYSPPSKTEPLGSINLNEERLRLALRSLEATGFAPEQALPAVVWSVLPTVMHETQHAIQLHELARRGGVEAHFVEMETDGKAVGVVTYLQILEKHPEAARLFMFGKSDNNDELAVWRTGLPAFRAETLELYRAKDPLIPTLETGEDYFKRTAETLEASLAEIDGELKTAHPDDRAALQSIRRGYAEQLAVFRDPQVVAATLGYFRERHQAADAMWARWSGADPKSRLAAAPGLPAKERAELHLRVARQLSTLSPTLYADDIEANLTAARGAAVQARDGRLVQRAGRELAGVQGRRLDYALDVVRGRAAVTDDAATRAKIMAVQDEHLKTRLWPQHYRVFKEEAARAAAGR